MFSLGSLKLSPDLARINLLLDQASPIVLTSLMSLVIFHGYLLIQQSNGGSDLVSADIPKSLMFLDGQNPYSTQPWASPYPPLLLLTVSGVIRLRSEEHTSELQSLRHLVCRLLLEKKKIHRT